MDMSANPINKLFETPAIFDSLYTWLAILAVAVLAGFRSYLRGPQYFGQTSMKGKVAIVTGGNRGIGYQIASELALRGAKVYIGCRDETLGKEAEKSLRAEARSQDVHYLKLTLGSFADIRKFAETIKKKEDKVDVLVNNAGVMVCPRSKTVENFEYHFGVNYIGPYLLTMELLDLLKAAAPSRIIFVSSAAYALAKINFDDINLTKQDYGNGGDAFSQSKLAVMLMADRLSRDLADTGVTVNTCHPGVVRTDIHRYMPIHTSQFLYVSTFPLVWYLMKSAKDGAQTPIFLAVDESVKATTGKYFVDMQEKTVEPAGANQEEADKLCDFTKQLIQEADERSKSSDNAVKSDQGNGGDSQSGLRERKTDQSKDTQATE